MRLLTERTLWDETSQFMLLDPYNKTTEFRLEKHDAAQGLYRKPTFELPKEAVQELFNQLWAQGYRPADGTGNSGHTHALQAHLEDMRTIVFNHLNRAPKMGIE